MFKSKSNLMVLVLVALLTSCTESTDISEMVEESFDVRDVTYFNEFVACRTGSEYSPELMNEMISEWRNLIGAEALVGGWIYLSASDTNTYPEGAWWELQWDSEVTATEAWATWVDNEQVAEWTEKYANVFNCDGQNRNSFEAVFPIGAEEFGEFSESGYFHSEVSLCNYENGASSEEAKAFLESYTSAVRDSNYEGTGYHFGNYYGSNNPDADFLWAEFTNSAESTEKVAELFTRDIEPTQFPLFSKFASCNESTDKYNGWTVFERDELNFTANFTKMN